MDSMIRGRNYDKDGNLIDWWTAEDAVRFKERADKLVDQYDQIIVIDTLHANGRFTLGENIADHGGLLVAHQAYLNSLKGKETPAPIDGFTNEQRFFLGVCDVVGTKYPSRGDPSSYQDRPAFIGKMACERCLA